MFVGWQDIICPTVGPQLTVNKWLVSIMKTKTKHGNPFQGSFCNVYMGVDHVQMTEQADQRLDNGGGNEKMVRKKSGSPGRRFKKGMVVMLPSGC